MYAKVLREAGGTVIPMLLVTPGNDSRVIGQLHERGWVPWGGRLVTDSGAQLRVMPDHLSLHIDGQSPLDDSDGDPVSPPGWWEQVDRLGGVVFLAVVPTGTPFHPEGLAGAHKQLLDSPETATALVPVIHA